MADFAPNYTARVRLRYNVLGKTHSMGWRVASSHTSFDDVITKMGLFLGDLATSLYDNFSILSADAAVADSDVFLPLTPPTFAGGSYDHTSAGGAEAAFAIHFPGRSSAGGKGGFYLYGTGFSHSILTAIDADYRITSAENSGIAAAVTRLNETGPTLVGNDDHAMTFYDYVTIKPNDSWVRRLRRG